MKYFFYPFLVIILIAISSCDSGTESSSAELIFQDSFTRYANNSVINPRDLTSPLSQTKTVGNVADPCSFWDEEKKTWRVFWSLWDINNDLNGLPSTGIFGATSTDGVNFTQLPNLSLEQQGTFDSKTIETCDIVKAPHPTTGLPVYFMYYSGSVETVDEDLSLYKIGLALSEDGEYFTPLSNSLSPGADPGLLFGVDEGLPGSIDTPGNAITDPTIVYTNNSFYMWTLCLRQVPSNNMAGGICFHTSNDGVNWTHHGLTQGLTSIAFPIQPTVYFNHLKNRFEMLFIADTPEEEQEIHDAGTNLELRVKGWYQAHSDDGLSWTLTSNQRVFSENTNLPWENGGFATGADAEVQGDNLFFYYPSFTTRGGSLLGNILNWPLNLATKKLDD